MGHSITDIMRSQVYRLFGFECGSANHNQGLELAVLSFFIGESVIMDSYLAGTNGLKLKVS